MENKKMSTPNPYEKAAREAAKATDEKYSSILSSLCRLKDDEISHLFPDREDKDKLLELIQIVNDATNENQKIVKLKENIDSFGKIIIRIFKTLT
jgi:hypothetical protein